MTLPVLGTAEGVTQEEATPSALALGIALQLTNILRDVGEDARRGRIYLPLEDLRRFGITEEEIIAASTTTGQLFHEERYRALMEYEIERCERFYCRAEDGV